LSQRPLAGDAAMPVERDALRHFDAERAGAGAAGAERMQEFRMHRDTGAAADEFDRGTLVYVAIPADLAQERGGEQSRHRTTDDDGPALFGRWSRHCRRMLV